MQASSHFSYEMKEKNNLEQKACFQTDADTSYSQ